MGQVYKITNMINNKCYIGITKNNFFKRYQCGKQWWKNKKLNKLLVISIQNYGIENFSTEILEEVIDNSKLDELEKYYIQKYNAFVPNGFNLTKGGMYKLVLAHEVIEKIRKTKLDYYKTNLHPNLGKKLNPESIIKRTETRRKISGYKAWNKGLKTGNNGEETIKKSAIAHYKPVAQYDINGNIINIFESVKMAGETLGIDKSQISRCKKGYRDNYKGFTWKALTKEEYIQLKEKIEQVINV